MTTLLLVLALTMLLALVAVLSAAATAVRSVSHAWLLDWVEQRLRGVGSAEVYLERTHRLLQAAGVASTWAFVLAGMAVAALLGSSVPWLALGVLIATLAFLIIGQLVPAAIAMHAPAKQLPVVLPTLRFIERLFAPFVASRRLVDAGALAGPDAVDPGREEIEELLREGELEGIGDRAERVVITGVLDFGARPVRDVMRPREEVFALDASLPPLELAEIVANAGYSRIPLFRGTLDNIIGMIHAFDILKAGATRIPEPRRVLVVPPERRCSELLFQMLRGSTHLAIVADDHGRTVGLVTVEDLVEELVGDIHDEHDEPLTTAERTARHGTPA